MAAAVPSGVSSRGGSSRRRAEHLLPLPRTDAPTPTIRASSSRCSEALEGAAPRGDDPSKGMGKQVVTTAYDTGGRGGHYRRGSSSSYYSSAAPLTRHQPAVPPVSSRGGRNGRKTHGSDDASSSLALRPDEEQERLLTRANFLKPHSIQRNIRLQAARHASLRDRRVEVGNQVSPRFFHRHRQHVGAIGATNEEISPRISEKENGVDGQKYWQTDSMPSRILSVRDLNSESGDAFEGRGRTADCKKPCALPQNIKIQAHRLPSVLRKVNEASQVPPRLIQRNTPDKLMRQTRSSCNYRQLVGARDATNGWELRKGSEMKDEVADQDRQSAIVASRSPSARDWDAESNGVTEAIKPDSDLRKASATPQNIGIEKHKHPSLLGRSVQGGNQVPPISITVTRPDKLMRKACFSHNALDDIKEPTVSKGYSKKYSSVTTSNKFDGVALRKGLTTSAKGSIPTSGGMANARTKAAYATTLGRGGYGDPHPPPFYKCKVCCKRTAFYRLKCCHLVVCDHCGCDCDAEDIDDKKLQFHTDEKQSNKEQLPKVKFQGTDLFLWQPFSFPADLMLCMAKRAGFQLQYYFAPIHELMDSSMSVINATVYSFYQIGRNARSLKVTEELILRNQLK